MYFENNFFQIYSRKQKEGEDKFRMLQSWLYLENIITKNKQ